MKHTMRNDLLPIGTKRRSGIKINKVRFGVSHDTGNPNSTAQGNVNYYKNSANDQSASAQVFIDEKEILICIPLDEKAWHVIYEKPIDNQLYGDDANDIAIGIELCYFPNDYNRSLKAYEKYVWFHAWLAYTYKLDISKDFVGHYTLDPQRKTDPMNAFKVVGKTFAQFLKDVQAEYNDCTKIVLAASVNDDKIKDGVRMFKPSKAVLTREMIAFLDKAKADGVFSSDEWKEKALQGELPIDDVLGLIAAYLNRTHE